MHNNSYKYGSSRSVYTTSSSSSSRNSIMIYSVFCNGKWFESITDYFVNLTKPKSKSNLKTVYKSKTKSNSDTVEKSRQRKIDDILDKISKSGYDSLTKEEKDFLFRAGK